MILIEDVKHACVECIRGHRSSQCKHHTRPLLQVRSKGRPNIRNNPNLRIAVFSKQVDNDRKDDKIIRVVKASMKYIIDYKTNDIIGPYDENSSQKMLPLKIDNKSFITKTSCCSQKLTDDQSCGCSGKPVNKSKILKKYLKKRNFTFINNNDEAKQESIKHELNRSLNLNCTIPGTCCCDEDCNCEGCVEHNIPAKANSTRSYASDAFALSYSNGTNGTNDYTNANIPTNNYTTSAYSSGPAANRLEDIEGFNHITDLNVSDLFNSGVQDLQNTLGSGQLPAGLLQTGSLNQFQLQSPQPSVEEESDEHTCSCPPNACNCSNCETHEIINGVKLEDLFGNLDYKYL